MSSTLYVSIMITEPMILPIAVEQREHAALQHFAHLVEVVCSTAHNLTGLCPS